MAPIVKFLCFTVFCSLLMGGESQCSLSNLAVKQSATGKVVGKNPEWKVTIPNGCQCTQLDVKVSAPGFQSVEPGDPLNLSKDGDNYLVNNGDPIYGFQEFSFTYAWDTSFKFTPVYSRVACSGV